ncbi:FG-GAP-like repeat-containing protein [Pseudoxanthomonas sp. PXM02]|uniref:NHL domain-containing protein n=1 Tax=Pseudoxanthomonas sp. PXM02 TaxID=2769294 RepID=UPI00177CD567|nr:FG-GAP-like repeat-containing protein [Pseudoxanthomonas sp. PXM02]MBD9479846.1 VCBS repeat-containing protein [Pseudoxanthomonas sp. PXM02]
MEQAQGTSCMRVSRLRWLARGLLAGIACLPWSSVYAATPIITTIAGGGNPASGNGDGGPATQARLVEPIAVAADPLGNVFVAERFTFKVRRIGANGIITTVAGNGQQLYDGDGKPTISAGIDVSGLAVDAAGNLYIADRGNRRIRKVAPNGVITSVVASGLASPTHLSVSPTGEVYVLDQLRIWKVVTSGLQLVAGTGEYGSAGDGGPATAAQLANPRALAFDRSGRLYIVDNTDRIRRVGLDGRISTIAGAGPFRIDPVALSSRIHMATGAAVDSRGNTYIALSGNQVRVVSPAGIIGDAVVRTIDEGGMVTGAPAGFRGDGGPALDALLYEPEAIAIDGQDNLYIADTRNHRIRKVTRIPTPRTPAGLNAFAPQKIYGVGSFVRHVAIGDITGDGRQDALLTTSSWSGPYVEPDKDLRVWLFVQQPDGTLASPKGYPFEGDANGGRTGSGLDTGDFNGDGFEDVVVGTLSGITVFLGSSSGLGPGLAYHSQTAGAQAVQSLTVLDVDRDGRLDVVTLSAGKSEGGTGPDDKVGMLIYFGNGRGGIARQSFRARPANVNWGQLRATDVNNDGLLDLTSPWSDFVGGYPRGGFEITPHDTGSNFGPVQRWHPAETLFWGPGYALGDFDGDGRKDVVVAHSYNTPLAKYAQFKQTPDGGFLEVATWPGFDVPAELLSADMNNDGRDDLLVIHDGWSSIGYMQQLPTGGLDVEIKYEVEQSGNSAMPALAVGDLNGDGCRDVAMSDRNYGLVVLEGRNCMIRANGSQPLISGGWGSLAATGIARQAWNGQENGLVPPLGMGSRAGAASLADARHDARSREDAEVSPALRHRVLLKLLALLGLLGGLSWFFVVRKAL